jgi:hypothetical protein
MNTKHTKTVIIILLAAANIFFLFNILSLNAKIRNIPGEMIENAAAVLNESGISADVKNIPAEKPSGYIYEGEYSENIYGEIVKSFSGAPDEEIINGKHAVSDVIGYDAGEYKFRFADYSKVENLKIEISKKDYPEVNAAEEEISLADYTDFDRGEAGRAETVISGFMKKYPAQDVRTGFGIVSLKKEDGCDKVLINQTADGLLIYGNTAYIEIRDGEVAYFSGRWYFGEFSARYNWKEPLLDSVNILFRHLENNRETIKKSGAALEKMEPAYNMLIHETGKFYLEPSWEINFKDGRRFLYSMIPGSRTKIIRQ